MKVMLLNPPAPKPMIREGRCQSPGSMRQTSIPQLSLACMGGLLRNEGAEVILLECMALNLDLDAVIEALDDCGLVFVNTTTPTIAGDLTVIRALKAAAPDCRVGAFGCHVTAMAEETMAAAPELDFVIRGEPEVTALEVYRVLKAGKGFSGVEGLTHRDGIHRDGIRRDGIRRDGTRRNRGEVVSEADRPFSDDLDRIAIPDRSLLPNEKYVHPISGKPYTIVNVSRGCPGRCSFCVARLYYGRKLRRRSVESVLDELQSLEVDHVWMYADELTADKRFLKALCEGMIERKLKIKWWSNSRGRRQEARALPAHGAVGLLHAVHRRRERGP